MIHALRQSEMSTKDEPIRPIKLSEIRAARERIANTVVRTPLIRLELGPEFPDIRLKLENLQPINAYKLRGAANAAPRRAELDDACTLERVDIGTGRNWGAAH